MFLANLFVTLLFTIPGPGIGSPRMVSANFPHRFPSGSPAVHHKISPPPCLNNSRSNNIWPLSRSSDWRRRDPIDAACIAVGVRTAPPGPHTAAIYVTQVPSATLVTLSQDLSTLRRFATEISSPCMAYRDETPALPLRRTSVSAVGAGRSRIGITR